MASTESWRTAQSTTDLDQSRPPVPPKSTLGTWLRAWWPAFLWAGIISFLSTDSFSSAHTSRIFEPFLRWLFPSLSVDSFELMHHIIRKCAHFTEYFIFLLLLYRGLRGIRRGWQLAPAVLAWFIASGYSALDEIHQSFVASRGASPWDSLLDSASALAAVVMLFLFYRLRHSTNK